MRSRSSVSEPGIGGEIEVIVEADDDGARAKAWREVGEEAIGLGDGGRADEDKHGGGELRGRGAKLIELEDQRVEEGEVTNRTDAEVVGHGRHIARVSERLLPHSRLSVQQPPDPRHRGGQAKIRDPLEEVLATEGEVARS